MIGDDLKSGNLNEFNTMITHLVNKNTISNEAGFMAFTENRQSILSLRYIEKEKSTPITRVRKASDYTGGRTTKYEEYAFRIVTAFNAL